MIQEDTKSATIIEKHLAGSTSGRGSLRYRSHVDAKGYTMLLNCVLYDTKLSDGAKVTYMVLLDHARQEQACYPGQERLATERGVTARSVRNHLAELESRGLISVEQRGLNQTNLYWIEDVRTVYGTLRDAAIAVAAPDRKNFSTPDRKKIAAPDRKSISVPERQNLSDKETAEGRRLSRKKTAADSASITSPNQADPAAAAVEAADSDLVTALVEAGVNQADAVRLASEKPEECERQLEYLPFVSEFKTSRGAYLRSAIEQGFGPPKGYEEATERKAKAAKRAETEQAKQAEREQQQALKDALRAAREALMQSPEQWEQIVSLAESRLPALLRGKPGHVAYQPALEEKINQILAEGQGSGQESRGREEAGTLAATVLPPTRSASGRERRLR